MREIARQARGRGLRVGLVPTMGSLHEGHVSLIEAVNKLADVVVATIFVNPTQFGPNDDFERYPRDLTRDADICVANDVDYLFTPELDDIYPPGPRTYVEVTELSDRLEGASRPGHFRGVTTVVLKLFEIARPHVAAFGQKDAQQAIIIQRMAKDLMLDVELLTLPTVRDEDGLALSSRNRYLSAEERQAAGAIPQALEAARQLVADGQTQPEAVLAAARGVLENESLLRIDYLELVEEESLSPVASIEGEVLLLLAVHCGPTRLIDNATLSR
jgi:pantoate--beta-alanine ligase